MEVQDFSPVRSCAQAREGVGFCDRKEWELGGGVTTYSSSLSLGGGLLVAILGSTTFSQEMGRLETFGADGRLFSSGSNDYFLLSRQSYLTEDSSGYDGQIRVVKKYPGGGYEVKMRDYIARCRSYDDMVYVVWYEAGEREKGSGHSVDIKNPDRFPGSAAKDSYNLYWAACHAQFRKFK